MTSLHAEAVVWKIAGKGEEEEDETVRKTQKPDNRNETAIKQSTCASGGGSAIFISQSEARHAQTARRVCVWERERERGGGGGGEGGRERERGEREREREID